MLRLCRASSMLKTNRGFPLKKSTKTGFLLVGRIVLYNPEVTKIWFLVIKTAFSIFIKAWKEVLQKGKWISVLESRMFTNQREDTDHKTLFTNKLIFKVR